MITIVIPTYNERDNIKELVARLETALRGIKHEIIFVDDNSNDGTVNAIRDLNNKNIEVIVRIGRRGLTGAVVEGVKKTKGERIVVMDADLSHPPEKIPEMIEKLNEGYEIIIGSRFLREGGVVDWPLHRKVLSLGATAIAKFLFRIKCSDPMSGFFVTNRSIIDKTAFKVAGYKILMNILKDNPHAKIYEVPYMFGKRHGGETKLGGREVFQYIIDMIRLYLT